ncbi:hypothetical protein PG985_003400 [Apiospora marii]|uniref:CFEM domain-containing protein n=1 Tax=Apiospora marii TaxID=335849 RepID=A0ABR1RVG9_9PEZI
MRLRHVVLAGMSMATSSRGVAAEMTSCVRSCYAATAFFLGCSATDAACACRQQPNLIYFAEPCLAQECRDDDLLLSLTSITDLCGSGPGAEKELPPAATQSPTGGSGGFSYKVVAPNPTTIPGTTVVTSGGAVTRTIAPVTIKAQQAPVTVTPSGAGSGSGVSVGSGGGGGGGGSNSSEDQASKSGVARRHGEVGMAVIMLMCVGFGAALVVC